MDEPARIEATETESAPAGPDTARRPAAAPVTAQAVLVPLVLIAALLGGAYFRFTGLDWDHGQHLHPDERFLTMVADQWSLPVSLEQYFDNPHNPVNPYNYQVSSHFVYGPLPVVSTLALGEIMNDNCEAAKPIARDLISTSFKNVDCAAARQNNGKPFTGYDGIYLVGRALNAVLDLLGIVVLFFLGRRLYGPAVATLACVLMAGAVMLIQQAHFFTVDAFANFFVVLALYFAVRAAQGGKVWDFALFGAALAGAVASKINTAPLAAVIVVSAVIWVVRRWQMLPLPPTSGGMRAEEHLEEEPSLWKTVLLPAAALLVVSGLAALLTFRIMQPYAFGPQDQPTGFVDIFGSSKLEGLQKPPIPGLNAKWWTDMQSARMENSGEIDSPPGKQWTNRTALVFPWLNMVLWGMGLPLGLAAWFGWTWAGWRMAFGRRAEWTLHLLPFLWVALYFLFMGMNTVKSMRYMLPLYPPLCLFAAWALVTLWTKARARGTGSRERGTRSLLAPRSPLPALGAGALIVLVVLGTWAWAFAFTRIYNRPVTREEASRWIFANVPTGTTVLYGTQAGPQELQVPIQPGYVFAADGAQSITPFKVKQGGALQGVRLNYLLDPAADPDYETVRVAVSGDPGGENRLAEGTLTADLGRHTHPRGDAYIVAMPGGVTLLAGQQYYLIVQAAAGAPVQVNTSHVANESWDDGLPIRMDGNDGFFNWYQGLTGSQQDQIQPYWEDDENKRQMLIQQLGEADYIFLSSSRAVWSVTRLPMRYPMMVRYYGALMDGSLGYDLVATFHSAPDLGPLHINDVTAEVNWGEALPLPRIIDQPYFSAEEAFNVYDHPPVWIFKKNADRYSDANTRAILESVDLTRVVRLTPAQASKAGNLLLYDEAVRLAQEAGGTWSQMFDANGLLNRSDLLATVVWWLLVVVLGWLAFPLLFTAAQRLPDGGYPLAKTLALLLLAWAAWWLGSLQLVPFTRLALFGLVLVLLVLAALLARRRWAELRAFLREQRALILITEGLTFAFFLLFVFIRVQNPDLWHPAYGGEKPMDFAYLNAVIKSSYFPPIDPWFAGGYLNYYYWGFIVAAVPIKLLGIVPATAYNLILPTLYALTAAGAFSVAYNIVAHHSTLAARVTEVPTPPTPAEEVPEVPEADAAVEGASPAALEPVLAESDAPDHPLAAASPHESESSQPEEAAEQAEAGSMPDSLSREAPALTHQGDSRNAQPANAQPIAATPHVLSAQTPVGTPARAHVLMSSRVHVLIPWRAVIAGVIAALLVTTLGNLGEARLIYDGWAEIGAEGREPVESTLPGLTKFSNAMSGLGKTLFEGKRMPIATGEWYWNATRVINHSPDEAVPITEFPFFTFLYADLHAHMIALPLTLLALGLALAWLVAAPGWELGGPLATRAGLLGRLRAKGPLFLLLAIAVGALRPTNTWDWPTYLAVAGAAFFCAELVRARGVTLDALLDATIDTAALLAVSTLFYWPFLQSYAQPYSSAELWKGTRTEISPYLTVHGFFLFVLASFMLLELWTWVRAMLRLEDDRRLDMLAAILIGAVVLAIALTIGLRLQEVLIAPVAVPLIVLAGWLTLRPSLPDAPVSSMRRAVTALVTLGLLLTVVVEIVVLKGDISRMNTVFKFYLQVWVLFGVSSAVALAWLWPELPRWPRWLRTPWAVVLAALVVCIALYPIWATRAKMGDRWVATAPMGLDGIAFMPLAVYADNNQDEILRYDYDAIRWIQDNVPGSPVIAEAPAGPSGSPGLYHWVSRISIYTGNPTIVGWDWHQRQQRAAGGDEQVGRRTEDAAALYAALDADTAMRVIRRYHVSYIYVGPVERAFYSPEGLAKFDQMAAGGTLQVVYQNDGAKLFEVVAHE